MVRMFKWFLPVLVLVTLATIGQADTVVLCTSEPCVADIPTASPVLTVGSDSEGGFDPFGAGFDTSDGIVLNGDWAPDPAFAASFGPNGWQQLPGTFTWVLPANLGPCGSENETICEPVGKWFFTPGSPWNAGTPDTLLMLEDDGSISDIILVNNTGPGGSAAITFSSDPFATPEPGTITLLGLGLVGVGIASRRRKSA
jgi:hypothetical protein